MPRRLSGRQLSHGCLDSGGRDSVGRNPILTTDGVSCSRVSHVFILVVFSGVAHTREAFPGLKSARRRH